ncbi:MAG: class I SAM-dependent methyltransferase [Proteobacteria bacterium]|nr:class I SAM-dependent methyltransferase [Pseudomonadota bacterium]MDA1058093.1 class I SAM-dependent methyltransferase [Pseudomonadota bacterium]
MTDNAAAPDHTPTDEVAFGFRKVPRADKSGLVRGVFDSVSGRYDVMNDVMSGGLHRLWKDTLVRRLRARPGQQVLDVAGGTGDIALRILRPFRDAAPDARPRVSVLDINEKMLRVGRDRGVDRGYVSGLEWACGDAQALPLPDRSMDAYTVAFGIRNMTDIAAALREAYRVLRPGGHFLCLEFSRVAPLLAPAYDAYSLRVLPVMGRLIARDAESYRYLAQSIRTFPAQDAFAEMIGAAGFGRVSFTNLSGGIVALHSGWRT